MPGTSLILAVIVAVWIVYLLQHWIRRRDHLATARSVDRFSEAMRVLERRRTAPRFDVSAPVPRSYSVAPARPRHPDVMVKRAHPGIVVAPARKGAAIAGRHVGAVSRQVGSVGLRAARVTGSASRTAAGRAAGSSSGTRRAVVLVLGALLLTAGSVLTGLEILPWWSAAAGAGAFLVALVGTRWATRRARRRAASPVRPRRAGTARPPRPARAARATRTRPTRAPASVPLPGAAAAFAGARGGSPTARRSVAVYDVEAHPRRVASAGPGAEPAAAAPTAEPEPGTWSPVPVPVPTYTLKARAPRGATPVQDLPFDGHAMALEEEFEDLPAVYRVVG